MLEGLKPNKVWKYFEEICAIPHGSGNIGQISAYLRGFAEEHGLAYIAEPCGNVIIRKDATPGCEQAPAIVIQGHMDMVAVADEGCGKDMTKDGLDVAISEDGQFVYAKGTSLGGDDGIALAYGLAVLAADNLVHPAIELVATVDEETGMDGARELLAEDVRGRRWLNLDSEDEGVLLAGCAGGLTQKSSFSVSRDTVSGDLLRIAVTGCRGGHSGTEIDKNRANAILLLALLIREMDCGKMLQPLWIAGGEKDNAIPTSAEMVICVNDYERYEICRAFDRAERTLLPAFRRQEPDVAFVLEETKEGGEFMIREGSYRVMNPASVEKVLDFLLLVPFGVSAMSTEPKGLVETSNNVGIVRTIGDTVVVDSSVRSMVSIRKKQLGDKIALLTSLCGGIAERHSEYPGWEFRPESPLREAWVETYREVYGEEPVVQTIHAGLECGLIIEHMPETDAISFGPNIFDIHTTKERMEIASVERTWNLLVKLLERLGEKA